MIDLHGSQEQGDTLPVQNRSTLWRKRLFEIRSIPLIERFGARIQAFSPGDRIIFYLFASLVAITSLAGLHALEKSLLITVPTYGGTLTEGEVGSPQFINPLLAISDADRDLSSLVYAGLMGLSNTGSVVPVLAESYTISNDGKTYTFTLREDAKFQDGTPVTANDVVFTVEKAHDAALKSPEYVNWSGVNARAIDQRTIRFTLQKAYAPFLGLTTLGILPARLWQNISNEEFPFSTLETNPVGAGPFKVTNVSRDASGIIRSVTLAANPYFALGRPYLDNIYFNFYSRNEDLVNAHASGIIESAYGIPDKNTLATPYARVFGVFLNPSEKQVYVHAEVRKALSFALDRQAIVTNALGGYATPIMGPVPPGNNHILQTQIPQSNDTVARATKILTDAGWNYDSAARAWKSQKNETLNRITLRTSNVPELKNVATAVKADWEQLGIQVDIELYEPGDLLQNVIRPRKYEALLYGMVIGRDQDLYAFWNSQERNDPGLNIAQYANKTIDTLLETNRTSTDANERAANLQKIEDIISADYPAAFIYAPDFIYTVPNDLRGVILPQIITPSDRFATAATWYRMTDAVWPFFTK